MAHPVFVGRKAEKEILEEALLSAENDAENATPASGFHLRLIRPQDNAQVARLIRTVMTEFECTGEGYSILDPEVDDMHGAYSGSQSVFYVIANQGNETVMGCGGIAPLAGGDPAICELKKMYFYPELRGLGLGRKLVDRCLEDARNLGFRQCYLETVVRMVQANALYKKMGFMQLDGPLGSTGHNSCDAWYMKRL